MSHSSAALYTVSDARYFPGLVALVNSLRLTGHQHELVVGDCGLTPNQRQQLRSQCSVFDIPREVATHPYFLQPFASLLKPVGTLAIIDSDVIVTGSLEPILVMADAGKICAYPDEPYPDPDHDRWFAQWQPIFGLAGPPRRQIYVASHLVALSTVHWPEFLARWWDACQRIAPGWAPGDLNADPLALADQDALNALLMSEVPRDGLAVASPEERLTTRGLNSARVLDAQTLACVYHGHPLRLMHCNRPKPWEPAAWPHIRREPYIRLLRRLLHGADLALRVPPEELPVWLRPGRQGQLALAGLDLLNAARAGLHSRTRPLRHSRFRRTGRKSAQYAG